MVRNHRKSFPLIKEGKSRWSFIQCFLLWKTCSDRKPYSHSILLPAWQTLKSFQRCKVDTFARGRVKIYLQPALQYWVTTKVFLPKKIFFLPKIFSWLINVHFPIQLSRLGKSTQGRNQSKRKREEKYSRNMKGSKSGKSIIIGIIPPSGLPLSILDQEGSPGELKPVSNFGRDKIIIRSWCWEWKYQILW